MIKKLWQELIEFIDNINTTNTRILTSVVLASIIVLTTLVMLFLKVAINETVLGILCAFVVSLGGLDVVQFTQKRKSFKPEIVLDPDSTIATKITATVSNRAIGDDHGVEFTE